MNWDAVGAVGEVVGAVAVVATLAYLATQVRYAKAATVDANRLVRANGVREMMLAMVTNDEAREGIIKGSETEPYYEAYAQTFGITVQNAGRGDYANLYYFWLHWGQFASSHTARDFRELRNLVNTFYRVPAVRYSWDHSPWAKPLLEPEFVAFVDEVLAESHEAGSAEG